MYERKILRKIFSPKRIINDGDYEVRKNEELDNLYREPNFIYFIIIGSLKSTQISRAGHVCRSEGMIKSITKWKQHTKRLREDDLDKDG